MPMSWHLLPWPGALLRELSGMEREWLYLQLVNLHNLAMPTSWYRSGMP